MGWVTNYATARGITRNRTYRTAKKPKRAKYTRVGAFLSRILKKLRAA